MSRAALERIRDDLKALLARVEAALVEELATDPQPLAAGLAWGAKVSAVFRDRVKWIGDDLGLNPNDLMACMAWESGRSFRADIKNMAGSGATGLIQFMPATARSLGTTVEALARMTPEDQLNFVWKYFAPFKGKLKTLSDIYMAILWPKAVGQPDDYALFTGGVAYRQNAGLDTNKDGRVTKREAAAKVMGLLDEGLRPGNIA
jgi:Transglycosylase SLT domain